MNMQTEEQTAQDQKLDDRVAELERQIDELKNTIRFLQYQLNDIEARGAE